MYHQSPFQVSYLWNDQLFLTILIALTIHFHGTLSQKLNPEWIWLDGDKSVNQLANANYTGSRSGASVWTQNKTVFLFGGNGFSDIPSGIPQLLNDFWTFDIESGKFDQKHPSSFSTNVTLPDKRQHAALCGNTETLFLFGGFSNGSRCLSDLWSYDMKQNKWLKWSNFTSAPSARGHSAVWCHESGMYLFGGMDNNNIYNDMWLFNYSTAEWIELQSFRNLTGLEGNLVYPSGRNGASTWVSDNVFYMFGGNANPKFSYKLYQKAGLMSDLWKYNPEKNEWSYVSGSLLPGQISMFNELGATVDSNTPGSRIGAAAWTDSKGNLWLFSGAGADLTPANTLSSKLLADVWRFHLDIQQWAFMGGSKLGDILGKYEGEQQHPGARTGCMVWKISSNKAAVFGGLGRDGRGVGGCLNDLWSVDFSAVVENQNLISTASLLIFVGLGCGSLFSLLIYMHCSNQIFTTTIRRFKRGRTAKYKLVIND